MSEALSSRDELTGLAIRFAIDYSSRSAQTFKPDPDFDLTEFGAVIEPVYPRDPAEIHDANLELLHSAGWTGSLLLQAYEQVINSDPWSAYVAIHDVPDPQEMLAYAIAPWNSVTGEAEVYLPLGSDGLEVLKDKRNRRPRVFGHIAGQFGVEPESVEDETMVAIMGMHEFGHGVQYRYFQKRPKKFEQLVIDSNSSLPLAAIPTSVLQSDEGREFVFANQHLIQEVFGVSTPEELVILRDEAYRQMPLEAEADRFAADVIGQLK